VPNPDLQSLQQRLLQLEDIWRRAGDRRGDLLRPGLTVEQVDEATEPLGLQLPAEAKVWWGWHDGADSVTNLSIGPGPFFRTLEEAVSIYQESLSLAQEAPRPEWIDWAWPRWVFPFAGSTEWCLVVDCRNPGQPAAPVGRRHISDASPFEPGAPSMLSLVENWIELYESGLYHWNGQHWEEDYMAIPLELRGTGLY
jgi:SMI1/KNR4 family protein SUKH-1